MINCVNVVVLQSAMYRVVRVEGFHDDVECMCVSRRVWPLGLANYFVWMGKMIPDQ